MSKVDWDDFVKGFKYFGIKRMQTFIADEKALELLAQSPENVRREAYIKCQKHGIDWPSNIPVDTSSIAEDQPIVSESDSVATEQPAAADNTRQDDTAPEASPEEKPEQAAPSIASDDPQDTEQEPDAAGERFVCNHSPNLSIFVGEKVAQFVNGELIADDPKLIDAVCDHPWFCIHIHPDNADLRR